jgi:short-subunit dehydrogenase
LSQKEVEEHLNVNVNAMAYLTHYILPLFLQRKNKKCAIINLSSHIINFALRNITTYSGTKAFNDHFSRSLA